MNLNKVKVLIVGIVTLSISLIPVTSQAAPPTTEIVTKVLSPNMDLNRVGISIPGDSWPSHDWDSFSVSMDNVNWSNWYSKAHLQSIEIKERRIIKNLSTGDSTLQDFTNSGVSGIYMTLPSGDGYKNVYVKTAKKDFKRVPVYSPASVDSTTGGSLPPGVTYVTTTQEEFIPTGMIFTDRYLLDLTPPKANIRTPDNLFVGMGGKIELYVDVVDGLDPTPKVKVEVLTRYTSGASVGKINSDTPIISQEGKVKKGTTTLHLPISGLDPLRINEKSASYLLKVTTEDSAGNVNIITKPFFIKTGPTP